MKVDRNLVDKIAELARLEFNEAAGDAMIKDMNNMLAFVDKLNELDTEGIEPLIYMTDETAPLRPDEIQLTITQDDALRNAPKHDSDYFKVPKVIDKKMS